MLLCMDEAVGEITQSPPVEIVTAQEQMTRMDRFQYFRRIAESSPNAKVACERIWGQMPANMMDGPNPATMNRADRRKMLKFRGGLIDPEILEGVVYGSRCCAARNPDIGEHTIHCTREIGAFSVKAGDVVDFGSQHG